MAFKAPTLDLTVEDLVAPDIVFQIGIAPRRIDLLTSIAAVEFEDAWASRYEVEVDGIRLAVLSVPHLIQNKKATGRPKDAADAAWLASNGNS